MSTMFAPRIEPPALTRGQRQILAHIVQGNTIAETANALGIGTRAVEQTVIRIRRALHARNTPHMCALAAVHGLVDRRELLATTAAATELGIAP
jgi:DNA-binding CsgD family transcriptional regulator